MRHELDFIFPALELGPSLPGHGWHSTPRSLCPLPSCLLLLLFSDPLANLLISTPHQSGDVASTGPCCHTHSGSSVYPPHSRSSCNSGSDLSYLVPLMSEAFCLAAKELGSRDCHLAQVTGLTDSKLSNANASLFV